VTPWVWRLIVANAVVLLLLMTLTPALTNSLAFDPRQPLAQPWTYLTYMFVHGGLGHLALNMLLLFYWGTALEQRMGGRPFILFYLYCGLGGPLLSLMIAGMGVAVGPFIGASAAIMGLGVAYTVYWPDAEMLIFPLPFPIKVRYLVVGLLALDLILGVRGGGMVAHWAHLGGAMIGYLYLRLQSYSRSAPVPHPVKRERVLVSRPEPSDAAGRPTPVQRSRRRMDKDPVTVEIDRVLDKISAQGMDSLTHDEREFLHEVSARKKKPE